MELTYQKGSLIPRKKVFPGLGGINKNIYRKGRSLRISLNCISKILGIFAEKIMYDDKEKKFLRNIQKDLNKLSKYEKYKKEELYLLAVEIATKYKV